MNDETLERPAPRAADPARRAWARSRSQRMAGAALVAGVISLFSYFGLNGVLSPPGNPGIERPVVAADVFVYTFQAFAFVLVATGVTMLLVSVPYGERRPSGYLAAALTWIATVFFVFIALGRREQADLFEAGRADLLLDGALPGWEGFYSAGYLFVGAGIALFGWALHRTGIVHRAMGYAGTVIGVLLAIGAYVRLVFGRTSATDAGLLPTLFLLIWLVAVGIVLYKRAHTGATVRPS